MVAQFNAPPTDGIATRDDQRRSTIEALRRELLGYRRTGKAARADAVVAELSKLGVDVLAEEKAEAKAAKAAADAEKRSQAEAEKPADAEQATV